MKKYMLIAGICMVVLGVSACGNQERMTSEDTKNDTIPITTEKEIGSTETSQKQEKTEEEKQKKAEEEKTAQKKIEKEKQKKLEKAEKKETDEAENTQETIKVVEKPDTERKEETKVIKIRDTDSTTESKRYFQKEEKATLKKEEKVIQEIEVDDVKGDSSYSVQENNSETFKIIEYKDKN